VSIPLDGEVFPVHSGFEYAVYCIQEIVAVSANMETDQIRGE
jgi:hypothetical protein